MECYDRCQEKASAKEVRESIPRQVDKKSGVPEEEKGVWGSQGGDGVWNSQEGGKDKRLSFFLYIP